MPVFPVWHPPSTISQLPHKSVYTVGNVKRFRIQHSKFPGNRFRVSRENWFWIGVIKTFHKKLVWSMYVTWRINPSSKSSCAEIVSSWRWIGATEKTSGPIDLVLVRRTDNHGSSVRDEWSHMSVDRIYSRRAEIRQTSISSQCKCCRSGSGTENGLQFLVLVLRSSNYRSPSQ